MEYLDGETLAACLKRRRLPLRRALRCAIEIASALDLIDARSSFLEHKGRHIAMWIWGARSKEAPAVLLSPAAGDQAYVTAPEALSVALL